MNHLTISSPLHKLFVLAMFLLSSFGQGSKSITLKASRRISSIRGGAAQAKQKYRVVQVQLIHRHGDRTPITTLKDEEFWRSTLISSAMLDKISQGTEIIRRHKTDSHSARGKGPFGKLTQLGLLQMVNVGACLREELCADEEDEFELDDTGNLYHGGLWSSARPLSAKDIKIMCTDFPRTIQSVQGVLVGLFPDGLKETMHIDCRHTSWMIPDPQPRRSKEQEQLEIELTRRPHMLEREIDMFPLAVRCTAALESLLGEGAFGLSFGVDGTKPDGREVLTWAQLSEITCCLKVRDRLPDQITPEDQDALSSYLAWRWFESLRHPRLIYLAMHKFAHEIVRTMIHNDDEPLLTIYSAHDSTLVGLLCAFRLEQPIVWPDYGSSLKVELLESANADGEDLAENDYVVRFYLNGQLLRSQWHGELRDQVPLSKLSQFIATEGAVQS